MAKNKIERIDQEIAKPARRSRSSGKAEVLEAQKTEAEIWRSSKWCAPCA